MIYGVRPAWGGYIPRICRGTPHADAIRALRLHTPVRVGHQRPRSIGPRPRLYFRRWHAPYYGGSR